MKLQIQPLHKQYVCSEKPRFVEDVSTAMLSAPFMQFSLKQIKKEKPAELQLKTNKHSY